MQYSSVQYKNPPSPRSRHHHVDRPAPVTARPTGPQQYNHRQVCRLIADPGSKKERVRIQLLRSLDPDRLLRSSDPGTVITMLVYGFGCKKARIQLRHRSGFSDPDSVKFVTDLQFCTKNSWDCLFPLSYKFSRIEN